MKSEYFITRLLVAIDEFFNVVLFNGNPHESISQHASWDGRPNIPQGHYENSSFRLRFVARFLQWAFPGHLDNVIKGVERE